MTKRKTRILVNKQVIAQNRTNGTDEPVVTAKDYKRNHIVVDGRVVASVIQAGPTTGAKPLNCGARVSIETTEEVRVS